MREQNKQPNILLIMSDQHNRKIAGCYGDSVIRTPNMDKLARNGVLFENAYCPSPLCCPSRMSFLTGKHPSDIKVWDNNTPLSSGIPTFAHALGQAGYETILCGRMHIVGPDQRHGFKQRIFPEISTLPNSIGDLDQTFGVNRRSFEKSGYGQNPWVMYDDECISAARNWFNPPLRNAENPFCMVVGLVSPHCPYLCTDEDLFRYYLDRVEITKYDEGYLKNVHPYTARYHRRSKIGTLSDVEIRRTKAAYYAMVEHLDTLLGSLLKTLNGSTFSENTIVMYMSDHGDMLGEHGLWWKMSYYEGSAGIPLICSWPGSFPKGVRNKSLVSLFDMGPTLMDFGGAPNLPHADGVSFKEILYGKEDKAAERRVFSELLPDLVFKDAVAVSGIGPTGGPSRMLRKGDWKCNYYYREDPELYHLSEDPDELHNRANDPSCRRILDEMIAEITRNWNPEAINREAIKQFEEISFIGMHGHQTAPWDPEFLKAEYWDGAPENYGQVLSE